MSKQSTRKTQQIDLKTVQTRILGIYDDFAELQDQCSFLCDAFTSIAQSGESIEKETIRGAIMYADCVKDRAEGIKADLKMSLEEIDMLATSSAHHGWEH